MKKLLISLFVFVLLLCLASCGQPEPTPEPEPPVIVDPLPEPEPEPEPDPSENDAKLTEEELAQLEAFRAEPKEPWGELDLNFYTYAGELFQEPYINDEPNRLILSKNHVTYRGQMLGDGVATAITYMNLPSSTVLSYVENEDVLYPEATVLFYNQQIVDELIQSNKSFSLTVYFDDDFQVITDEKVLDFSKNGAGIKWAFTISFANGVVDRVGTGVIGFADYSEGGR